MSPEQILHEILHEIAAGLNTEAVKLHNLPSHTECDEPKPADQVGGTHYSDKAIQPIEYIDANGLGFYEANVVKYITRYKQKNGIEDLEKCRWYLNRLISNLQEE